MLSPPTVKMTRCPVCNATGKTGTTLGFGGTICVLCHGACYLRTEPFPCPCCDANGGFPSLFGLRWTTCRLCHGVKYLIEKPFPCPKCRATGQIRGPWGLFTSPCDLCDRQCYIRRQHGRCIKCNFSSFFANYFRKCINCAGVRYSPEPQHLCPRCNSTGRFKGHSCMLCGGSGVIHHEVAACANCNGAGEIKRTLSILRGSQSCPTCVGQGYFTVIGTSVPPPRQVERNRGKRSRGSDDEGDEDPREDGPTKDQELVGGSEPRRRVKPRTTPTTSKRRQTISAADLQGAQQHPPSMMPSPKPKKRRSSEGEARMPEDSSDEESRVFSPGVAGVSPAKRSKGKHRRFDS